MDSRNNNNSNNNNSFNNLFYQVIHNKYLFNKIIQQIHINDWDLYNDINSIHFDNRIKFKNIHSLQWMIINKQFALLKCKLEEKEYIELDLDKNQTDPDLINWLDIDDCEENILDSNSNISYINKLKEQVFKLLLNKSKESYCGYSKSCFLKPIHQLNEKLLKVVLDPFYQVEISYSILKSAFLESTPEQLKLIIESYINKDYSNSNSNNSDSINDSSNNNGYNNNSSSISNFKKRKFESPPFMNQNEYSGIKLASRIKDLFHRDRVLKLILSDKRYYNVVPMLDKDYIQLPPFYGNYPQDINNNDYMQLNDLLFNIISTENQNKLLELDCFSLPPCFRSFKNEIYRVIGEYTGEERIFKLTELIATLENDNLSSNKSMQIDIKVDHLLDINNLKLFLENNKRNWRNLNYNIYESGGSRSSSKSFIDVKLSKKEMQYIKFYSELEFHQDYQWFRPESIDSRIKKLILSSLLSDSTFKDTVNFINNQLPKNSRFIKKWLGIINLETISFNSSNICLSSTQAIDLIKDNYTLFENNVKFTFSSLSLLNYASLKFKILEGGPLLDSCKSLNTYAVLFQNSIINYNELEIGNVAKLISKMSTAALDSISDKLKSNKIAISNKQMDDGGNLALKTVNIYIKIGNYSLVYYILRLLSSTISNSSGFLNADGNNDKSNITIFLLPIIENIKIQHSKSLWIDIYIKSIKNISLKRIKLLNKINFNPIISDTDLFKQKWSSVPSKRYKYIESIFVIALNPGKFTLYNYLTTKKRQFKIISIIKILIQDYADFLNHGKSLNAVRIKEEIERTIIYLYSILVISKNISVQMVTEAYQLINSSSYFTVPHSTLFSIYYLSIKSMKYIKYLQALPFDQLTYFSTFYVHSAGEDIINSNIGNLDPKIFSFEYIFNIGNKAATNPSAVTKELSSPSSLSYENSFDIILKELIYQLSYSTVRDIEILKTVFNYNLNFTLDINRPDLFIEHFKFIQNQFPNQFNDSFIFSQNLILKCMCQDNQEIIEMLFISPNKLGSFPSYSQLSIKTAKSAHYRTQLTNHFNNLNIRNLFLKRKETRYIEAVVNRYPIQVIDTLTLDLYWNSIMDYNTISSLNNHFNANSMKYLIDRFKNNNKSHNNNHNNKYNNNNSNNHFSFSSLSKKPNYYKFFLENQLT